MALAVLTAAVTGVFGALVLSDGPRRTANVFLAAFLFLIAANQLANAAAGHGPGTAGSYAWVKVASVFSALDPFALFYFAAVYPERNELHEPWKLGLVGLGAVAFAGLSVFRGAPTGRPGVQLLLAAWATYTVLVYTWILAALARRVRGAASARGPVLLAGLAVAIVPAWPRAAFRLSNWLGHPGGRGASALLIVGSVALPALALAAYVRGAGERERQGRAALLVPLGLLAGALVGLAVYVRPLVRGLASLGLVPLAPPQGGLLRFSAPIRWTLFCVLLSVALFRYRMLDLNLRARRRAARAVSAILVLAAGAIVLVVLRLLAGDPLLALDTFDLLVLVLLLVGSQGARALRNRIAHVAYGVPEPGDRAAAVDAYREVALRAAEQGRTLGEDDRLARLREDLGLDERLADVLHEMARSEGADDLEEGARVAGRYRVGRGLDASGGTRLARDELLDRDVVLKAVRGEGEGTPGPEEARLAAGLNHPNLLTFHDVLPQPWGWILVTEHVPGGSLADRLEDEDPLEPGEAVSILDGVLDGLETLHETGIVHRDLKPSNVLLGAGGRPVVADFGIAGPQPDPDETSEDGQLVLGTPAFMAPEQARGEAVGPATDVYAAGLLLDRCLEGELPAPLERLRDRALAEDPDDRWASAAEMRAALQEAAREFDAP